MTTKELYNLIGVDLPLQDILNHTDTGLSEREIDQYTSLLTTKSAYQQCEADLKNRLEPDEDGIKMLKVMLEACKKSYLNYNEKSISKEIFTQTMKCFTRFVEEYKSTENKYGFDRSFWVGRQLSLCLFRIGELEYELSNNDDGLEIAMHIPSKADISVEATIKSIKDSKFFIKKYFPEYQNAPYVITTWLLSPCLKEILSIDSKIIKFQNLFDIKGFIDNDDYKFWVFKNKEISPENFPTNTKLQQGLKQYVLSGKKVGEYTGYLKFDLIK